MFFCSKTYRHYLASFLLGLFCFVLTTQAIHLLTHHHEHEEALCSEACNKNQAHFHEVKHEIEKCALCDFTFSIIELPDIQLFILRNEVPTYSYFLPFYEVCLSTKLCNVFSRGPPNLI